MYPYVFLSRMGFQSRETVILSRISENEINLVSDMQAEFGQIENEIQEFKESYVAQNWPNYGCCL